MLKKLNSLVNCNNIRQLYFMCLLYKDVINNLHYCPAREIFICSDCEFVREWRSIYGWE